MMSLYLSLRFSLYPYGYRKEEEEKETISVMKEQ
jgi:hypothetical protein